MTSLLNNLDKGIYELNSKYACTSYYYHSMSIQSLLILFKNYEYYMYGIDQKTLNSRIMEFPNVIDNFKL